MTDREAANWAIGKIADALQDLIAIRDQTRNIELKGELGNPINELSLEDLSLWCDFQASLGGTPEEISTPPNHGI